MNATRTQRLTTELQQEIAVIIHQELKDPRLGFVTITRLELSKDLRRAKVFFGCLGRAEERVDSQKALDRGRRFIHGLIKKRFRLKIIPELSFHYDASIVGAIEMSQKLDQLNLNAPPAAS